MKKYLKIFLTAFLLFSVGMIIVILPTGGQWVHYGDFNVQQIPFYMHVHDAIRSGNWLLDFSTDLGGSLVGCYSFYLLASPFFWLTIPFPTEWIPYLMPWIMTLKYAVMAVTAYAYMRRHLKTEYGAEIGAMLYAFSGFMGAVLVFNHFHDVLAFFPLYLILFEDLMEKKRKLGFILMTTFMIALNYYFFVGEVVFLIIYFFCRYFMTIEENKPKFHFELILRAFFCGLAGVLLSGVYLMPAIYSVLGNSRLGQTLNGNNLLAYQEPTMILAIIKNTLLLPDMAGKNTMFNMGYSRVSGVAAYLPMISISGVMAFFMTHKKHWATRIITVSMIFAAVPVLNSLFSALNSEYYARWFYMPILVMAMMSADVLENANIKEWKKSVVITGALTVLIALFSLLPAKTDEGVWTVLGDLRNWQFLLVEVIFTGVMLLLLFDLAFLTAPKVLKIEDDKKSWYKFSKQRIYIACMVTAATMMVEGTFLVATDIKLNFISQGIQGEEKIDLEEDCFYRVENEESTYNYPMIWGMHPITSFISTIPSSTIDFYQGVGITRKVTSKIGDNRLGTRTLLSGRYYFVNQEKSIEKIDSMDGELKGYEVVDNQNGFDIYENKYFVPMGFAFDTCISTAEFEEDPPSDSTIDKLLMRALILSPEDVERYNQYMNPITKDQVYMISNFEFEHFCNDRRESACTDFKTSTYGFTATSRLKADNLLFFSVPYEDGYTAYVDGVETEIVKADWGFMAIFCEAGEHQIEFKYIPSNLKIGICMSVAGVVLLIVILVVGTLRPRKRGERMIKFGILAPGNIANAMAKAVSGISAIERYAVASRDISRARDFAAKWDFEHAYGSYEDLVNDPDVKLIYIASPHSLHYEHAKLCLEHGKHVLVEKAFTVNAEQAKELIDLAKSKKLLLAEAIWTRYMPSRKMIDEIIESGELGEITSVTANLGYAIAHVERMQDPNLAGGALLDLGVYPINFARMVIHEDVESITSKAILSERGIDLRNSMTFTYKSGRMVVLHSNMCAATDRRGLIYGDKGFAEIQNINNCEKIRIYNNNRELQREITVPEQINGYEYEVQACIKALENGQIECQEMPHEETIYVMELMDQIRKQWGMTYPCE